MSRIANVLLDLDGTLLGSFERGLQFKYAIDTIRWFRPHASAWATLKALARLKSAYKAPAGPDTNDVKAVRAFASALKMDEVRCRSLLEASVRDVFPKLERHCYPIPGAAEFVAWARQRYPLYLVTNPVWQPEYVRKRVEWAGIDPDAFRSMTHVERMHCCKPRREYYEEFLAQEGLEPATCLLIGNDRRKDLPATRAGISVYLLSDSPRAVPFEPRAGRPQAWHGTYAALRELL